MALTDLKITNILPNSVETSFLKLNSFLNNIIIFGLNLYDFLLIIIYFVLIFYVIYLIFKYLPEIKKVEKKLEKIINLK